MTKKKVLNILLPNNNNSDNMCIHPKSVGTNKENYDPNNTTVKTGKYIVNPIDVLLETNNSPRYNKD